MATRSLPKLTSRIGRGSVLALILVPLLAAAITAALLPRLVASNTQASATVAVYPVIGTHAAYEVSSYVADFIAAYGNPGAQEAGAQAAGVPSPDMTAVRQGDNAGALVTFTAPTAEAATMGLHASSEQALKDVVAADVSRRELVLKGSQESMRAGLAAADEWTRDPKAAGMTKAEASAARATTLQQGVQQVSTARADLSTSQAALERVPQVVQNTRVRTEVLSSLPDQIRVVATAAVSAFVLTLLALLLASRRRSEL